MRERKPSYKYEVNRGKECSTRGCGHRARVKGKCINCYALEKQRQIRVGAEPALQ